MGVNEIRRFPIEVVLTVVHEKLLCEISKVYEICNYLSGDTLWTHQLPRAHRILGPWVLEQHPQIAQWDESGINSSNYREYIGRARERFGIDLPVTPIPRERWVSIDPISEAAAMVGDDRVIVVSDKMESK